MEQLSTQASAASAKLQDAQAQAAAESTAEATKLWRPKIAEVQAAAAADASGTGRRYDSACATNRRALWPGTAGPWPKRSPLGMSTCLPDGRGLPEGTWRRLDRRRSLCRCKCASCHGDFAEGVDNWPVLAGGFDTLADEDPVKTVGSLLAASFNGLGLRPRAQCPLVPRARSAADETYAIVAYILYSNDLVDDDFELSLTRTLLSLRCTTCHWLCDR